jgi:hypothetical protein
MGAAGLTARIRCHAPTLIGSLLELIHPRAQRFGKKEEPDAREDPTLLAFATGIVALAATVTVLGGVSEDVTQHNGLATHDVANLRLFIDHRSEVVVHAARIVSDLGGVAVLALIAIGVGSVVAPRPSVRGREDGFVAPWGYRNGRSTLLSMVKATIQRGSESLR